MSPVTKSSSVTSVWLTKAITLGGFFLLYFPLVVVVMDSFWSKTDGWGFFWYAKVFQNEAVLDALGLSIGIGFLCAAFATVLGTFAALALAKYRFFGYRFLDITTYVPLVIPEIVLGLSLLVWFVFLKLTLGFLSILLAHITFCISYVVMIVKARLKDLDPLLEEAAYDLGASRFQTFWKVTFPLLWPALLSGGLMAFTLSFDDFIITFYTTGVGTDTLPMKIYSMVKFGISPEISAVSTLVFVLTLGLVLLVSRVRRSPQ